MSQHDFKYLKHKRTNQLFRIELPAILLEHENQLAYRTIDTLGNNLVLYDNMINDREFKDVTEQQFYRAKKEK